MTNATRINTRKMDQEIVSSSTVIVQMQTDKSLKMMTTLHFLKKVWDFKIDHLNKSIMTLIKLTTCYIIYHIAIYFDPYGFVMETLLSLFHWCLVALNSQTFSGLVPHYGWKGPEAAFYQTFDGSEGLVLRHGDQQMSDVPLVAGKVMDN